MTRGSSRAGTRGSKTELAKDVWTEILGYFFAHRERTFEVVTQLGLTPGDMKTLFELDPDPGCSMSELANTLHCDASNATWLVDRLEERGLVERRPHPRDLSRQVRRAHTRGHRDEEVARRATLRTTR